MLKTLKEGLPQLGLELNDEICQQLCDFGAAMVKQNEVMNLTGITEDTQVAKLHLLDSSRVKFEICQETVSAVCQWMELPCQTLPMPLAPDHTSQLSLLSVLVSLFKEIKCASHCWVYNKEV